MYKKQVAEAIGTMVLILMITIRMKHIKHILLSSVILLLSAGCTKEELPKVATDTPGITINLRIADPLSNEDAGSETNLLRSFNGKINGQITTKASSLTSLECEKQISNAYVLIYAHNAANDVAPTVFQANTNLDKSDGYSFTLNESLLEPLTPGTEYDIYVLANLPTSTTAPTESTTKNDLLALQEVQFERSLENPRISFAGINSFTYDRRNGTTIYIDISRTVARLDILINELTLEEGQTVSVQINNQAATVPYYNAESVVPASDPYYSSNAIKYEEDIYRSYVYPSYTSGDGLREVSILITVNNSDGNFAQKWSCTLQPQIERNKIYEITCTLQ